MDRIFSCGNQSQLCSCSISAAQLTVQLSVQLAVRLVLRTLKVDDQHGTLNHVPSGSAAAELHAPLAVH